MTLETSGVVLISTVGLIPIWLGFVLSLGSGCAYRRILLDDDTDSSTDSVHDEIYLVRLAS